MMLRPLRHLPGARLLAGQIRRGWQASRPLPSPSYVSRTPTVGGSAPLDPFFPPNATTLANAAMSEEAAHAVMGVLDKLTSNEEIVNQQVFYRWAEVKFGRHWRFADITTVLWAAATLIQPDNYLEIGVRRGRSAAVVAATRPKCAIYGSRTTAASRIPAPTSSGASCERWATAAAWS